MVDASISGYSTKSNLYIPYNPANPFAFPVLPYNVPGSLKRSQNALSTSGLDGSRIGFRGTEDLGGGLAASFWLEAPISNDSGATGIATFARRSTVSLSGNFGEVRLGRDYTPTFWNDTVFDPFGTNGVGGNLISGVNSSLANAASTTGPGNQGVLNGGLSSGTDNYVRASNSIGYFLPPNLGGFYGQVQYALHENIKSNEVANSPSTRGRSIGGRLGYANGPLDVAASYGQSTPANAVSLVDIPTFNINRKIKTFNLGASYDFGVAKLFGEYSRVKHVLKADPTATTALSDALVDHSTSSKYTGALIGVTVPVGPGLIRAAYSHVKYNAPDVQTLNFFSTTNNNSSANKFSLGYVHNLSKRTALYATVAKVSIKNGQNPSAISGLLATPGGLPYGIAFGGFSYAPKSSTGYDFGIRHAF